MDPNLARQIRKATEAFHAFVYFSPPILKAYADVGLSHPRRAYYAPRSAPMGEVNAAVVAAAFYNFSPVKIAEHIPEVWQTISASDLVDLRFAAVGEHLPATLGDAFDSEAVDEALELAREAVGSSGFEGRWLAGAHAGIEEPSDPLTALWHHVTVLREHRGDGHLMALQAHDLDGVECLLYRRPSLESAEVYRRCRGGPEDEFAAGRDRLEGRGLDRGQEATEKGRELAESVEQMTDQLSIGPWRSLGQAKTERFQELMEPLAVAAQQVVDGSPSGQTMLRR